MKLQAHNWLVHKIALDSLREVIPRYINGRLLDIGCGTKPYKELLAPYVEDHIGIDHHETLHDKSNIDLFGGAYNLPISEDSFDCVLCTAVLEHLEEPELALKECYRILKRDGVAIYSVPFIWHLHEEPRDFYRYSMYGLRYLFEKVGFEIIELNALSGFWVTFGQLFVYNIYRFHRGPLRYFPIIPVIGFGIQSLSYFLDRIDKTEQWTWMYMIVVKKTI